MRTRDRLFGIIRGSSAHTGQFLPIDRRDFVNLRATPAPFAVEDTSVVVSQTEFLLYRCHRWFVPSAERTTRRSLSFLRATILAQNFHRFVHYFIRDVERGTKTNGMLA